MNPCWHFHNRFKSIIHYVYHLWNRYVAFLSRCSCFASISLEMSHTVPLLPDRKECVNAECTKQIMCFHIIDLQPLLIDLDLTFKICVNQSVQLKLNDWGWVVRPLFYSILPFKYIRSYPEEHKHKCKDKELKCGYSPEGESTVLIEKVKCKQCRLNWQL